MKSYLKFALLTISISFASKLQSQQVSDAQVSTPEIRSLESHRYGDFAYLTPFPTLLSLPENKSKDLVVVSHTDKRHQRVGGASRNPDTWIHELTANSDAVVVGRPVRRVSAATAQHTFVFSDYDFQVESILKDSTDRISRTAQIVVTRPGGVVEFEGRSVRAIEPEFQLFRLGERYLLFLTRLPETGTYQVNEERAFTLRDGNINSAKTTPTHILRDVRETDFISKVQGFAAKDGQR